MYYVIDTFNSRKISRHRSVEAAVLSKNKVSRSLKNGAYLPMVIAQDDPNGEGVRISACTFYGVGSLSPVSEDEIYRAELAIERNR